MIKFLTLLFSFFVLVHNTGTNSSNTLVNPEILFDDWLKKIEPGVKDGNSGSFDLDGKWLTGNSLNLTGDGDFFQVKFSQLTHLHLYHNNIKVISLVYLQYLTSIDLRNNPNLESIYVRDETQQQKVWKIIEGQTYDELGDRPYPEEIIKISYLPQENRVQVSDAQLSFFKSNVTESTHQQDFFNALDWKGKRMWFTEEDQYLSNLRSLIREQEKINIIMDESYQTKKLYSFFFSWWESSENDSQEKDKNYYCRLISEPYLLTLNSVSKEKQRWNDWVIWRNKYQTKVDDRSDSSPFGQIEQWFNDDNRRRILDFVLVEHFKLNDLGQPTVYLITINEIKNKLENVKLDEILARYIYHLKLLILLLLALFPASWIAYYLIRKYRTRI